MPECMKCVGQGFVEGFRHNYRPEDFLAGKRNSRIWVIGLNPRSTTGFREPESTAELENYFSDPKWRSDAYFSRFLRVSALFQDFGAEWGVASTDLVKCASKSFPPKDAKASDVTAIIGNCKGYLLEQLRTHKPSLILCNGALVCRTIVDELRPPACFDLRRDTSYWTTLDDKRVHVVLSGFLGRLDNYALRRLGREIEDCSRISARTGQ